MDTLLWIGTVMIAGTFFGMFVFNWRFFFKKLRQGDDRISPVPWVGGLAGALALFLCPLEGAFDFWWVPFCLDFGCIPNSLWLAYAAATSKI